MTTPMSSLRYTMTIQILLYPSMQTTIILLAIPQISSTALGLDSTIPVAPESMMLGYSLWDTRLPRTW